MNEAERNDLRDIPHQTAHQEMVAGVGQRLVEVRGPALQKAFAKLLGVHVNTYARWERGESECGASALARLYQLGINPTWVVTGRGPKKREAAESSHLPRQEELKVALRLVAEALTGKSLPPEKYAELVSLVYEGLAEGLPEAQILRFARLAAP